MKMSHKRSEVIPEVQVLALRETEGGHQIRLHVKSSQNLTQCQNLKEIAFSNGPVRFEQTRTNGSEFYRVEIRR
jgi:hypothetical protein